MSRSACRGRRPVLGTFPEIRHRPHLTAKLLEDRKATRFIVGPCGYGKTLLAVDYAEVVFDWAHVFWVNAQSPCFIRSLDDRSLVDQCLAVDERAALVVFDDLPRLDGARMQAFSDELDRLMGEGCEAIVCCAPSNDIDATLQRDRIRIGAHDLLLSDAELDQARPADERRRAPSALVGADGRIPCLVWQAGPDSPSAFARGLFAERIPAELLLALGSALVMERGTFADLAQLGLPDPSSYSDVIPDYPHLGFDVDAGEFRTPLLNMRDIAVPLKRNLATMVQRSSSDSPDELVRAWASALMSSGNASRACDLIRIVYPAGLRARWLFANAWELVGRGCLFAAFELANDVEDRCKGESKLRLDALMGLCLCILGDEPEAVRYAKRSAFSESARLDAKVCGLLVVARTGSPALRESALAGLERCTAPADRDTGDSSRSRWRLLAAAWLAGDRGVADLADLWQRYEASGVPEDVLGICASWLFALVDGTPGDAALLSVGPARSCERWVRSRLLDDEGSDPSYFAASAGLSMEDAHMRGMQYEDGPLSTRALLSLRRVEMRILAQRHEYAEFKLAASASMGGPLDLGAEGLVLPQGVKPVSVMKREVPLLGLQMFGRLSVTVGGELVPDSRFRRRTTRTLLALLALNHGKEVPRDSLARALWPDKQQDSARKSYYTVWSQLRKALRLADGTCPYLLRHHYGCSLEMRYVTCDIERFEEICRELQFGTPDHDKWAALFAEIECDFSQDLLPFEDTNEYIVQARNSYRSRLVDALISATNSITRTSDAQWGVWFARAALTRDETREDAYAALMRAQIASDQRTSAMMTYMTCREVLAEQLGIDPSPELVKLYESLLDMD